MRVNLINYTKNAKELLIFSKKTRLKMSPDGFLKVMEMSEKEKNKELEYVFGTISSSWEFVEYVILISGVTRAFTHQLVRHRAGVSFAQQTMRAIDMSEGFEYFSSGGCKENPVYESGMENIKKTYSNLIDSGVAPQDARGILPTNIKTNILMKINLRALSQMMNIRLCYKAQGEYQEVMREIRNEVLNIHPWTEKVLNVYCAQFGVCAFPGYDKCPIKKAGLIKESNKGKIKEFHNKNIFQAQPGIKKGKL